MKILYYFPYDSTFMTEWQKTQIFDELAHYSVLFEVFNPLDYDTIAESNEKLYKRVNSVRDIDLFMCCTSSDYIYSETVKEIKSLSIPTLLICFDNLHAPYMHKEIAPYFDLVWLTSSETDYLFKKWGCSTVFQPYASNPFAFKDAFQKSINRICFIGTPYGTRTATFNALANNNVDVDVFCKSFTKMGGVKKNTIKEGNYPPISDIFLFLTFPIGRKVLLGKIKNTLVRPQPLLNSEYLRLLDKVSNEEMNKAYSNYALSLNILTLRNTAVLKHPVQKLHLRTFEIPMACGLEFVEYNEELNGYFSEKEMVFYKDKEEMIDKAHFYLNTNNEHICREMKLRAREKAAHEHGWMNRFSVIFEQIGLKFNKKPASIV